MTKPCVLFCFMLFSHGLCAQDGALEIVGTVTDSQSKPVPNVSVRLNDARLGKADGKRTDAGGRFEFHVPGPGTYTLKVNAPGFRDVIRTISPATFDPLVIDIQLGAVAQKQESVTVTADVKAASILFPDPAQRV